MHFFKKSACSNLLAFTRQHFDLFLETMMLCSRKICVFSLTLLVFWGCREEKVDFSTQIKPILNKHCISCHGGVKQSGGFSVLFRQEALDTTESGKPAIIPGHPEQSEMIRRLTLKDAEERMPYKEQQLSAEEIAILEKWIAQGAEWGDHWAYVAPQPVAVPASGKLLSGFGTSGKEVQGNEIDRFIREKLDEQGLEPSPQADRSTLIRRVYLDLIGLPPTPEQAQAFISDQAPDAYEKVVAELLASPHFGEKWASWWLDLARYSDTKGYERDVYRNIWRYRDWVIRSFNEDKPFDQFTIEQLAGDMLPNATDEQLIATAFHRNTMNNDEGGTEDEEFRVAALIDRVNTTWEVWQSTTMGCVQCHSHPYDPFTHDEYYKSMAFFNNTRDEDTEGEHPNLRTYQEEDEEKLQQIRAWVKQHAGAEKETEVTRFLKTLEPKYHPHDFDRFVNGELIDTKWLGIRPGGSARLKQIRLDNKTSLVMNYWTKHEGGVMEIRKDHPGGETIARAALKKTEGRQVISVPLKPQQGKHDLYFLLNNTRIGPEQSVCGIEWFAFRDDLPGRNDPAFASVQQAFMHLLNTKVENTPVMIENMEDQARTTAIFERGNWLVQGAPVAPQVPRSLNAFPEQLPATRLGFAQWMVSKENPLTARTIVNRLWEQVFGYGIVETLEDFGTQGATPSHPALLDWLALRMMNEHSWSVKKILKDMVMSATYRQDSRVAPEGLQKDQANRWLARSPRVRLTAEQVRDQALAVSGLLSKKMYGPSVMPYQPEGIWQSVWNGAYWKQSEGEDQYRRGVYTFIKRTSPYPSMMMFDGSSREVCLSRRIRTNTPLQALVTLNDPVYVEAARAFAKRMMASGNDPAARIRSGYALLVFKDISPAKLKILENLYQDALGDYKTDVEAPAKLVNEKEATPELAAMTVVANALLNLDEVITKE